MPIFAELTSPETIGAIMTAISLVVGIIVKYIKTKEIDFKMCKKIYILIKSLINKYKKPPKL